MRYQMCGSIHPINISAVPYHNDIFRLFFINVMIQVKFLANTHWNILNFAQHKLFLRRNYLIENAQRGAFIFYLFIIRVCEISTHMCGAVLFYSTCMYFQMSDRNGCPFLFNICDIHWNWNLLCVSIYRYDPQKYVYQWIEQLSIFKLNFIQV